MWLVGLDLIKIMPDERPSGNRITIVNLRSVRGKHDMVDTEIKPRELVITADTTAEELARFHAQSPSSPCDSRLIGTLLILEPGKMVMSDVVELIKADGSRRCIPDHVALLATQRTGRWVFFRAAS
jgi:hypothetical protein